MAPGFCSSLQKARVLTPTAPAAARQSFARRCLLQSSQRAKGCIFRCNRNESIASYVSFSKGQPFRLLTVGKIGCFSSIFCGLSGILIKQQCKKRSRSWTVRCLPRDQPDRKTSDDDHETIATAVADVAEKVVEVAATVGEIPTRTAIKTVAFWVTAAVAFGTFVGITEGSTKASEFFAGYLLEQSLSVDNLFVFILIFNYFQVPLQYQSRVLTYGIAGAIFFRATMILLGVATLERFEAVNLLLASVLLFSSFKLLTASDEEADLSSNSIVNLCKRFIPVASDYDGSNFFTVTNGVRQATPLLLTLAVIELSDIAFAVDSIPAVFGVTRDPFIVFSSNLFAILGLRSLYTVISSSMAELEYLQPAVAAILGFIGSKMVLDFFGFHVPTEVSLGIVASTLGAGVTLSLLRPPSEDDH